MSKQEIIRVSDDMIQGSEYVYKDDFRFQRLSKDGKWYVTYKNHIINSKAMCSAFLKLHTNFN